MLSRVAKQRDRFFTHNSSSRFRQEQGAFLYRREVILFVLCLFVCLFVFYTQKRDFRNEWCKARALSLVSCLLFMLIIITSDGLSFHITMRSLAMERYETCRQPVRNCVISISEYVLCPFSIWPAPTWDVTLIDTGKFRQYYFFQTNSLCIGT